MNLAVSGLPAFPLSIAIPSSEIPWVQQGLKGSPLSLILPFLCSISLPLLPFDNERKDGYLYSRFFFIASAKLPSTSERCELGGWLCVVGWGGGFWGFWLFCVCSFWGVVVVGVVDSYYL